jgi:F420-dependent oxidoreductase-like protein
MKLGLAVANFTWRDRPGSIAPTLRDIAQTAEEVGFARLGVMDHLWQIGPGTAAEREMLEAYTTLGFLAGSTEKIELLALVGAVTYREPGLLAKAVTTLDVLSRGRAWLGIGAGAAFNIGEARGLGLPFPSTRERFDRLEEALEICLQMWRDGDAPYDGRYYRLGRTLNSPQPVRRPHPPILIGGAGETRTLRLVARYADACNLFFGPELPRKLDVLRAHCDAIGRDYDTIEKTVVYHMDPGERGEHIDAILLDLRRMASLGIDLAIGTVRGAERIGPLELIGEEVIPHAAAFKAAPADVASAVVG